MNLIEEIKARKSALLILLLVVVLVLSTTVVSSAMTANNTTVDYWNVKMGDQVLATVKTENDAKDFVNRVEDYYKSGSQNIKEVSLDPALEIEKITLKAKDVQEDQILTKNLGDVVAKLMAPTETESVYVTQAGDTLWDLSARFGMSIDELLAMNPQIDPDSLMPGDEFKLKDALYQIKVTTQEESISVQDVAFDTEYEDDDTMAVGEEEVVSEGVNGSTQVVEKITRVNGKETGRECISSTEITAPVTEVVKRGTKEPEPAPRQTSANSSSYTSSAPSYSGGGGSGIAATVLSAAYSQLGVSQDCTSLVSNSLAAAGIYWHSWPEAYASLGSWTSSPVPGDICIYSGHVAVYAGGGQAIHGGWNGTTTAIYSVYCSNPFIGYVHIG